MNLVETRLWVMFAVVTAATAAPQNDYADTRVCAPCHTRIYQSWQKTGMARSLQRQSAANSSEDFTTGKRYYHQASDTWFEMLRRDGRYYQRRWQIGFGNKETNVDEQTVDFVIGSGSHARTYLHETAAGVLLELPLGWYAEKGGYWAMNPGYEVPDQPNARRKITYECMFCHNSYPEIPAGHEQIQAEPRFADTLPEGIDCQRCHGPAARHVEIARTAGASAQSVRAAIVNPARLSPERRQEVCFQCHLETTSFQFTHSIVKYDRGPFSYRPGEPLADFMLFFDHPPARPAPAQKDDRFEIVNAVYRLRMSQCYLESKGTLQCTTCHDPHGGPGPGYNQVCRECHTSAFTREVAAGRHTESADCVSCHMPKRRAQDVVHAVMTDHYIQRRKPAGDLVADIPEPTGRPGMFYRGEELPYYPQPFPATPQSELYLGVAQVHANNNPERGLPRLANAIDKYHPEQAEFYVELGNALRYNSRPGDAVPTYLEALRLKPNSLAGLLGLGQAFEATGDLARAVDLFRRATTALPDDAASWLHLAQTFIRREQESDALSALRQALKLDPGVPETHYDLALLLSKPGGDAREAEAEWRETIRLQPDYSQARMNLANFLWQYNQSAEAAYQFEYALRIRPDYALAHLNYAQMLRSIGRMPEAAEHLRKAAASSDANIQNAARKALSELR
jgi:tetratricopeptide (TPR) repeat protein